MALENRADFVDMVAQAVLDKIEERQRVTMLVEMVVNRVIQLQKQEEDLKKQVELSDNEASLPSEP